MLAVDLKKYIYENNKIEYVLDSIGCTHIKFHDNKYGGYYSAARPDGDNLSGVIINNNQWLNYGSFSKGVDIQDGHDIYYMLEREKKYKFR